MKKQCIIALLALSVPLMSVAAQCKFTEPAINTDVCRDLNLNNKVENNPFYLKNLSAGCGIDWKLPGLPDLSLEDFIPHLNIGDACQAIKYITGSGLEAKLKGILK